MVWVMDLLASKLLLAQVEAPSSPTLNVVVLRTSPLFTLPQVKHTPPLLVRLLAVLVLAPLDSTAARHLPLNTHPPLLVPRPLSRLPLSRQPPAKLPSTLPLNPPRLPWLPPTRLPRLRVLLPLPVLPTPLSELVLPNLRSLELQSSQVQVPRLASRLQLSQAQALPASLEPLFTLTQPVPLQETLPLLSLVHPSLDLDLHLLSN